ncbi:MAG TPA: hypothetical protein VN317_06855 [Candidatus Methanoperedens sp.]|nr:hypothetical protein [Candidatus Methanoperedens sp.]
MDTIESYLRALRRRGLAAGLLAGAGAAALLNEAVRWASVGYVALSGRQIPIVDVGPFLLLALYPLLRRRWSRAAAAREGDARGKLSDRLVSYVDFGGRADVPAPLRRAQAAETAGAIAAVPAAVIARLSPWLAAGPALLIASLLYPFVLFEETETATQVVVHRVVPRGGRQAAPAGSEPAGGAAAARGPAAGARPGQDAPPAEGAKPRAAGETAPQAREGRPPSPGDRPGSRPGAEAPPPRRRPGGDEHALEQPRQIDSQRVGTALAKLVDPVYNPAAGSRGAAPPPAGSFAFRLLPKRRAAGAGAGRSAAQGEATERVTVDFDALPEQYRPLVRTYFELLAGPRAAPAGGTTSTERSGAP